MNLKDGAENCCVRPASCMMRIYLCRQFILDMGILSMNCMKRTNRQNRRPAFFFRAAIGLLCFVCYVCVDANQIKVAEVGSEQIVNQIEKQMDVEVLEEVWKQL